MYTGSFPAVAAPRVEARGSRCGDCARSAIASRTLERALRALGRARGNRDDADRTRSALSRLPSPLSRRCWSTVSSNACREVRARREVRHRERAVTSRATFPDYPVMPGVLVLEALIQLSTLLATSSGESALGTVQTLDGVRFKRQVTPGDVLVLDTRMQGAGRFACVRASTARPPRGGDRAGCRRAAGLRAPDAASIRRRSSTRPCKWRST